IDLYSLDGTYCCPNRMRNDLSPIFGPVYQGATFPENSPGMRAGIKPLGLLRKPGSYGELQEKADSSARGLP
ncbi:MAG: hypothetical protein MN733_25800, partial [Nitrososphaera sp.]|nr:hypothetical protein [Nitrososphaera sp.]